MRPTEPVKRHMGLARGKGCKVGGDRLLLTVVKPRHTKLCKLAAESVQHHFISSSHARFLANKEC